jgi:hypothetical protein
VRERERERKTQQIYNTAKTGFGASAIIASTIKRERTNFVG